MRLVLPIRELANRVHAKSNRWKAMALLTTYFDESGIHDDSQIVAIGGLLGAADTWGTIESEWLDALDVFADAGVTWYHSTDCDSGEGEFSNIPKELRFALANRLARILGKHDLRIIWSAVITDDWHKTVKDAAFLKEFPKPLHLCFRYCAKRLAEGAVHLAAGSSVGVVYSEQEEYQDDFRDIWTAYKRNKKRANLRSFTTAESRDLAPLQAADLVAYEMYKSWLDKEYGEPPPPLTFNIRKPLHYLKEGGLKTDFGGCYDAHALDVAIKLFKETGDI